MEARQEAIMTIVNTQKMFLLKNNELNVIYHGDDKKHFLRKKLHIIYWIYFIEVIKVLAEKFLSLYYFSD